MVAKNKKGQAAGAAILLAIIMVLIILIIIVMPPKERAELLGDKTIQTGTGGAEIKEAAVKKIVKESLLEESPGRVSYLKEREIEKAIPASRIFIKTESTIITERDSLEVKKAVFSGKEEEINFEIKDLDNTDEILLDFTIESSSGELIILLNDKEIFNRETSKLGKALKLPKNLPAANNRLVFKASSPGIAFWRTNEYKLGNVKIVAEITDVSARESKQLFQVSEDEIKNIEEATLRFSLSCVPEKMSKIEVKINEYVVFAGAPENCEDIFYYSLPGGILKGGNNRISFRTEEGDYAISHTSIKIKLKAPAYPIHYFELKDKHFITTKDKEAICGEVDGKCPDSCDEDMDKDCCFEEYSEGYWCDGATKNTDDRCVGQVEKNDCGRCVSGYEDEEGEAVKNCAGRCGDDKDSYCPSGCEAKYDKNCCFEKAGGQYWCEDLPINGIDFSCVEAVGSGDCKMCPSGYEGEMTTADCPATEEKEEAEELKKSYDVVLTLEFTDEEKKEAEVYVNGHKISFDTDKLEFSRNIDNYVEPWTNSIKIIPKNSFEIRTLKVELKNMIS